VRIAGAHPRAHLAFAGPDEADMQSDLLRIANAAGCADRVHFTGLLNPDQVLQVLADADLLLMTSESENFGMAAAEAMAAGLPVVISNKVGLARFVEQASAGRSVELDADSIAEGLNLLLDEPEQLVEMGQRGRRLALNTFDQDAVAQRTLECFSEILTSSNR